MVNTPGTTTAGPARCRGFILNKNTVFWTSWGLLSTFSFATRQNTISTHCYKCWGENARHQEKVDSLREEEDPMIWMWMMFRPMVDATGI